MSLFSVEGVLVEVAVCEAYLNPSSNSPPWLPMTCAISTLSVPWYALCCRQLIVRPLTSDQPPQWPQLKSHADAQQLQQGSRRNNTKRAGRPHRRLQQQRQQHQQQKVAKKLHQGGMRLLRDCEK